MTTKLKDFRSSLKEANDALDKIKKTIDEENKKIMDIKKKYDEELNKLKKMRAAKDLEDLVHADHLEIQYAPPAEGAPGL